MKHLRNRVIAIFFLASQLLSASADEADRELIQLYHHKPMYFLLGEPITKAQFSLKAKLMKHAELYFGYSQLIFWDLWKESRPFRDLNYNPEIFYRFYFGGENQWFDFGPYEHESNGKGGPDTRSWDRHYVRYHSTHHLGGDTKLSWSIKLWLATNYDDTNRDLQRYRGIYEVTVTLSEFLGPFFERNDLILRMYPGGKSTVNPIEGGRELTLRLKGSSRIFLANTVFQFFQGRGESLLGFRDNVVGFRAGFGL